MIAPSIRTFLARQTATVALSIALTGCIDPSLLVEQTHVLVSMPIPCWQAHRQVEQYMAQVKAFADSEAHFNIPMRCGPDWHCGNWWINHLNQWFGQQVQRVTILHIEIEQQCQQPVLRPGPPPDLSPGEVPLRVEQSPDQSPSEEPQRVEQPPEPTRTVAIDIPTTPEGYKP